MNIFKMKNKAMKSKDGEYVLGSQDTGSHACYMIYGVLKSNEKARPINPGKGHAEIILAVKGDVKVTGYQSGIVKEGSAFFIEGEHECFLENTGNLDAVYIIAGGHTGSGHH
jgi:hypothetical protein